MADLGPEVAGRVDDNGVIINDRIGKDEVWVDIRPLERGELENLLNFKLEDWQWVRVKNYVRYRRVE